MDHAHMGRLILILLAVIAVIAMISTVNALARTASTAAQEADVPKSVQTISYGLLIALMFGVVTGWFGGL